MADLELKSGEASAWFVTASRSESVELPEVKFSAWRQPPPDPDFLRRVRRLRWEKGLAAGAILTIWGVAIFLVTTLKHASGAIGGGSQTLIGVSSAIWWRFSTRRASPHLQDLLDLPPICPQFPVEVTYDVSHYEYGSDEGIVSFIDDWMHFQGRRTSWSLRNCDVAIGPAIVKSSKSGLKNYYASDPRKRVIWRLNGREHGIKILPMDHIDGLGSGLRAKFQRAMSDWQSVPRGRSEPGIWPPNRAAPGFLARLERSFERWTVIRRFCLAGFAGVGTAALLGMVPWWWTLIGLLVVAAASLALSVEARSLCAVAVACEGRQRYRPDLPDRSIWSSPGLWLRQKALDLRMRRARRQVLELLATDPSGSAFPAEIHYAVSSQEYRKETGIITVSDGWLRFENSETEWALKRSDIFHIFSEQTHWRGFFENRPTFGYILTWNFESALGSVTVLPLDKFEPLGAGLISRLAPEIKDWENPIQEPEGETLWPPSTPVDGEVARMEDAYATWSALKLTSHAVWISGVLIFSFLFSQLWFLGVAATILGAAGVILGEYRRGKLAARLEAIYYHCPGGTELVSFRRGVGPWWKKIDQPWVK